MNWQTLARYLRIKTLLSDFADTGQVLTKKNTTVYKDTSPVLDGLNVELIRTHASQAPLSIASLNLPATDLQLPAHEWIEAPQPRERKRLSRYASTFERLEAEKEAKKLSPPSIHDDFSGSVDNGGVVKYTYKDGKIESVEDVDIYAKMPKRDTNDLTESVKKALSATAREALLEAADDEEFMHGLMEGEDGDDDGYVTAHSYKSRGDYTTGAVTAEVLPEMTSRSRREVAAATRLVEASKTTDEVEEESWDTSMVAEYGEEIFTYMKELEVSRVIHASSTRQNTALTTSQTKLTPNPNYMESQAEIQWSMRAVLMDWLVQVHHRFGLLPETLFLCSNFIDRFLSSKVVSLGKLQLVGATALFIAAKYEEINCPSVQEIVYMVDGGYTVEEILKAERFMLGMLQFELGWPGPMSFLRRISKADDYDLETRTLAKYFLEITLMDERFVGSPPSFLAAGAHCLARNMLKKGVWVSFLPPPRPHSPTHTTLTHHRPPLTFTTRGTHTTNSNSSCRCSSNAAKTPKNTTARCTRNTATSATSGRPSSPPTKSKRASCSSTTPPTSRATWPSVAPRPSLTSSTNRSPPHLPSLFFVAVSSS